MTKPIHPSESISRDPAALKPIEWAKERLKEIEELDALLASAEFEDSDQQKEILSVNAQTRESIDALIDRINQPPLTELKEPGK